MKEINRWVSIGVLKKQSSSEWASPTFIMPKKDMTVRTISDFRELNKRIVRRTNSYSQNQHHTAGARRLHLCDSLRPEHGLLHH
jgi:hypothetical protein